MKRALVSARTRGSIWPGSIWPGSIWPGSIWPGSVWPGSVWPGSVWPGSVYGPLHRAGCAKGLLCERFAVLLSVLLC